MRHLTFGDGKLVNLILDEARHKLLPAPYGNRWYAEGWSLTSAEFALAFWGVRP